MMAARWKELSHTAKDVAGTWTAYTALGIATDLAVFDEHYLFAGARFLVYLVASLPNVVLLVLVLSLLTVLPYRLFSRQINTMKDRGERLWAWWSIPNRLTLAGIGLSLVMIQFVMRQCFFLSNVLLAPSLPEPKWLQSVLLSRGTDLWSLFFPGLVAGTIVSVGLCLLAKRTMEPTPLSRLLHGIFVWLVAVQCLLLPINHSILIADKEMPKVAYLGGQQEWEQGQEAWLVWEGSEGDTYLVRERKNSRDTRTLITLRRSEVKKTTMIAYDPILRVLFAEDERRAVPQQDSPTVFCP